MENSDICPDGDARTEKELIVKLIVAHFTAIVAFCNYQSLRNEKLDSIEPILFMLSPFIVVAQTALGLIIVHVSFLLDVVQSPRSFFDHVATYARQWNLLFGKKTVSESSQPEQTATGSVISEKRSQIGRAWIRLGRTIALFGTLFQFVATIFLYKRRKSLHGWESLTIVDHRTFELAVGGAAVSVMSLALLLKFPGFGKAPPTEYIPDTKPDGSIIFCRGDSRRCPSWYQILYVSDFGSTTSASTWAFCVASSTYKGRSIMFDYLADAYIGIYETSIEKLSLDISITMFYFLVGAFFALVFGTVGLYTNLDKNEKADNFWVPILFALIMVPIIIVFICIFISLMIPAVMAWIPSLLSGITCMLVMKGKETRALFSQPPFVPSGNATDCLLLWKDPMAEYMWSLV
ncbi:hypothetical protein F53441_5748 [Fusarium austroafricanum]|uniref:Uncharacterized protein n=1 Tax=Fusarium austroafricanum TaxID=2364996 RepID=A0A8H4P0B5_9HYPO|nr:hypothetical protein F53441_5748 [Fusarium austroafricanum]